jgi:hypothetical protein
VGVGREDVLGGRGQGRDADQAMFMISVKSWVTVQH